MIAYDLEVSRIAAAIGEPARARILYSLIDGHARTSTELAAIANVMPSTASTHLNRLRAAHLVTTVAQGKHRYYRLAGSDVAAALEGLSVVAGVSTVPFVPATPARLRVARTCYDHIAGRLGVLLHDRFHDAGWMSSSGTAYDLTPKGIRAFATMGIDVAEIRLQRRKFAYPCLDWSERQPHVAGALGAAILSMMLRARWVVQDLDSRSLEVTRHGRRDLAERVGIRIVSEKDSLR